VPRRLGNFFSGRPPGPAPVVGGGAEPRVNNVGPFMGGRGAGAPKGEGLEAGCVATVAGEPKVNPPACGRPEVEVAGEAGWLPPKANPLDGAVAGVVEEPPNENGAANVNGLPGAEPAVEGRLPNPPFVAVVEGPAPKENGLLAEVGVAEGCPNEKAFEGASAGF